MISFDTILETKIKSGVYQQRTFFFLGLIQFTDGIENVYMSILNKIIQKEYNLENIQLSILGSSYLSGIVLGSLICAFLADHFGRKQVFIIFRGLSVITAILLSLSLTFTQILVSRFIFGVVLGLTSPLGFVFISEISVVEFRGRFLFAMTITYVAGKIYLVLCCFIFLEDYSSGNWRGLILFNIIPLMIGFISSLLYLDESIRYYLGKGYYQKAFRLIEYMTQLNSGQENQYLTQGEKDGLISWQFRLNKLNSEKDNQLEGMFSKHYFWVTIRLLLISIFSQFQNMSFYLLMPFLLHSNQSGFETMLLLFFLEMIFILFLYYFIDDPRYGRVKILIYSSILLIIINLGLVIFQHNVLIIGFLMMKLGVRAILSMINILTCECYPLHLRSKACGIIQAAGRLATVPSPFIFYPLYYYSEYLPFGILAVFSLLMAIAAMTLKEDKTQKYLERSEKDSDIDEND